MWFLIEVSTIATAEGPTLSMKPLICRTAGQLVDDSIAEDDFKSTRDVKSNDEKEII